MNVGQAIGRWIVGIYFLWMLLPVLVVGYAALVFAGMQVRRALSGATETLTLAALLLPTTLAAWWCARHLLRRPPRRWGSEAVAVVVALGSAYVILVPVWIGTTPKYDLLGPSSPQGLTAIVAVRDAGFGAGADHYGDVRVVDAAGVTVATWQDPEGWQCRRGPEQQRESMRWTAPDELEFTTRAGVVKLSLR